MTKSLKSTTQQTSATPRMRPKRQESSTGSESGYENSASLDFSESETGISTSSSSTWDEEEIVHAIILPNYKENMDTLRETLDILASHSLARSSHEIYLAIEQGELGCEVKAATIQKEYEKRFRTVEYSPPSRNNR